ncbi:hypothetical protein [Streptomyces sp. NPDC001502]|uniref:hypothetical protein n=1 Tax=Streptomyces sp. NPDC001502 TaxID=3364578 RepID=UPI0036D08B9B
MPAGVRQAGFPRPLDGTERITAAAGARTAAALPAAASVRDEPRERPGRRPCLTPDSPATLHRTPAAGDPGNPGPGGFRRAPPGAPGPTAGAPPSPSPRAAPCTATSSAGTAGPGGRPRRHWTPPRS